MKPIPFLARALPALYIILGAGARPNRAVFLPSNSFSQLRLFATALPTTTRPFIFALAVPGLADVGES
jgi:hypothetical protein